MDIRSALRTLNHSETLLINERSDELEATGKVHRFGFGQSPFPVPEPLRQALARHAHEKAYAPVQGLPALRQAAARFHGQEDQVDWHADRVVIGPGSKLLIYAVLAAFKRAEVALISPSWVSYEPQAHLAGHPVSRLTTRADDQWRLLPQTLARFCAKRADTTRPLILILNSPGNPSGTSYEEDHLRALTEVLRRYQVLVISDEIYGRLRHDGEHRSLARYYPEGTVVTGGLSKWCGAGGWRLGIMHIPEALADDLLPGLKGVASETWSCVASPIQHAAMEAYTPSAELTRYVQRQREVLSLIGQEAAARLNAAQVHTALPTGGFYLMPDFSPHRERLRARGIDSAHDLCERLLGEARVALLPGSAFGMPTGDLTARLSYVNFDGAAALTRDTPLDHVAAPVMAGIDAIIQWLDD